MATIMKQNNENDSKKLCFHLIWLDKNMKTHGNRVRIKLFKEIDSDIETFDNEQDFINSIEKQNNSNLNIHIIFIISGAFSETIISQIQDYQCICAIYIFCTHSSSYEHLQYQKLRAIHTDAYELIDDIDLYIIKFNEQTDFSIFCNKQSDVESFKYRSHVQCSIRNLNEDLASFLWFRQMHEFMLTLDDYNDKKAKEEMLTICYLQCQNNSKFHDQIQKFQTESSDENQKNAIRWYTENSFIHQCTNTALRKDNIEHVYLFRYIIRLICRQLTILHKEFIRYCQKQMKEKIQVYRGQYLSLEEINLLKNNCGQIISLNGFVSTSRQQTIALKFIRNCCQIDLKPVLIEIDLDLTNLNSVPFADISQFSKYRKEKEVLLSIGSIFLIKSVKFNEELQVYVIELVLIQNEQITVTQYIEETYGKNVDSSNRLVLFGKLLFDMGAHQAAKKYFFDALQNFSNDQNQFSAIFLNNLGVCCNELGEKDQALQYYRDAMAIYEKEHNQRGLAACQHNIASIYHERGELDKASKLVLQALGYRQSYGVEKASTLDLLGRIYLAKGDFDSALDHFEQALDLRLKNLTKINPKHPDIGISHYHIGLIKLKILKSIDARNHFIQAAEIFHHNFSSTHPMVTEINKCLRNTR